MPVVLLLIVSISHAQSILDDKLSWDQIEAIAKNERPGQGIKFEELNWEQIKTKAQAENKAIFIDFYTTWCGPCKFMEQNVYVQKEVGDYMNANFVSVKVQMDVTAKDNDFVKSWYDTAKKMGAEYKVAAYPTLLFLNSEGTPSYKLDAVYKPGNFVKAAKMSLDANNGYLGKLKQFQEGRLEPGFVLDLIMHAQELGLSEEAENISRRYTSSLKDERLFTKENLMILYKTTVSSKDRGFSIFLNHADKVVLTEPLIAVPYSNALVGQIIRKEAIEPFLENLNGSPDWTKIKANLKKWGKRGDTLLKREEYRVASKRTEKLYPYEVTLKPLIGQNASWEKVLEKIKSLNAGKGEERLVGTAIIAYMNRTVQGIEKAQDKFFEAALYYDKNFSLMFSMQGLNDWAWFSFLKIDDKPRLEKALNWSEKSLEFAPNNPMCTDTYANLLYKMGRKEEAIKLESGLVAQDPANTEFKDTLEKMKKNEPTWNRAF